MYVLKIQEKINENTGDPEYRVSILLGRPKSNEKC